MISVCHKKLELTARWWQKLHKFVQIDNDVDTDAVLIHYMHNSHVHQLTIHHQLPTFYYQVLMPGRHLGKLALHVGQTIQNLYRSGASGLCTSKLSVFAAVSGPYR